MVAITKCRNLIGDGLDASLDNKVSASFLKDYFYPLHFVPGFAAGAEANEGGDVLGGEASGDVDSAGGEAETGAADDRHIVQFGDVDDAADEAIVKSGCVKGFFKIDAEEAAVEGLAFAAIVGWMIR